jgi:hypothetical protein
MTDDPDPLLTRLFAEHSPPAHGADFMAQLINLLERDRRNRRTYRVGMIIASVIVAALLAPWIAQVAAIAIGSVATGLTAIDSLLNFPTAWLVLCSLVVSFMPFLYLGVTRRW